MGARQHSRRGRAARVFGAVAVSGAMILAASSCGLVEEVLPDKQPIPHQEFVSRPDLKPPAVQITHGPAWTEEYGDTDELTFISPNYGSETPQDGSVILDASGELVWMEPASDEDREDDPFDLRVQEYRGEPVLTVYSGSSEGGMGDGEIRILDQSYEEIARVTTGGTLGPGHADFHDTTITGEHTMLIAAYHPTPADLSELGGPEDGHLQDAVIQEIDIATGDVLFEWSAIDHVPLHQTMLDFDEEQDEVDQDAGDGEEPAELGTEAEPFDYFHINSITEDADGSLLVSARHTNAVYRIDRTTGAVDWTLGGSASDFEMGEGATFAWQHDAHRRPDGTLTLFDNHAHGGAGDESSRGLRLRLDEQAMTAEVATEYLPPAQREAGSMANAQQLPNGNMLIGWGARPHYSEYTGAGELIYDVCHGDECMGAGFEGGGGSYRAYRFDWTGHPATDPDVVVQDGGEEHDGGPVAFVSWNGATEVARWRLVTGQDAASATEQSTVDRDGFETAIPVPAAAADAAYTGVQALDAEGAVLGTGAAARG
ncbi:arylsulfotransferase family protein [Microbacterium sp. A93]|uniref:arylsulfotransferase family protein n=1 Tax=Microbacterium sp. A93 TaxID=3450716 RepID=UPI003F444174